MKANVVDIRTGSPLDAIYEEFAGAEEGQSDLFKGAAPAPLWIESGTWEEATIPSRPWLARGYVMRGAVTVLSGPGSAGKSMLMLAWAIALVLGDQFHRFKPAAPLKVVVYNVEDDSDEQKRRLSATLRQFNATPLDLAGRLFRVGPGAAGTLLRKDPFTGRLTFTKAMERLEALIETERPDVLMLDPLVELHDAEENDNTAVRAVMARLRSLAAQYNLGTLIAHHNRKGSTGMAGDPDALRGASAIVGAARVVLTCLTMDEDEAKGLGIPVDARRSYFRVDGAKSNYAPVGEAEWFERVEHELANGELIAAASPWTPPTDIVGEDKINIIRAAVDVGVGGEPYTFRAGYERSLAVLCQRYGINTDDGRRKVTDALKQAGYAEAKYKGSDRHERKGIRSPAGAPANVTWSDE